MPEEHTDHGRRPKRIPNYLAEEYGVNINALFFRVFHDDGREYLTRA